MKWHTRTFPARMAGLYSLAILARKETDLADTTIPPTLVELSGLSEWRDDPLTGRRVRIAESRAKRPSDFSSESATEGGCAFCVGNEDSTPQELDRVSDESGKWLARAVPNRYPAFEGADGTQEVLIESPDHKTRFVDLTPTEAAAAVTLWVRRLIHWQRDGQFDYVLLFKNEGIAAGASLAHSHTQLLALPEVPEMIRDEWQRSAGPLMVPKERLIFQEDGFRSFCPPAPRFAGESWIVPLSEAGSLESVDSSERASRLAALLQRLIAAVQSVAQHSSYNLVFQIPPDSVKPKFANSWRIEIIPRNTTLAGFELATGLGINAVSPEAAAEQLRAIWDKE